MATTRYRISDGNGGTDCYAYVCDTYAERPTTGLNKGDRLIALDQAQPVYWAVDSTTWSCVQLMNQKGQPNGYPGLDGAGLVPVAQLPGLPAAWGAITGLLSTQTDLQAALDAKADAGDPPAAHATSHQSGGSDAIKLDDLAAPDDNTDLDASTAKHGLMKRFPGGTTNFLRADGTFAAPPGGAAGDVDKQLSGTSTIAANKCRVVVNRLTIPSGSHLVIEATGSLRIT